MNSKYDDKKLIAELAQNDDIAIEDFLKKRNLTEHRNFLARHIKSERFPFLTYGYYLEKVLFPRDGIAKPETGYFEMGCQQKEEPSPEKLIHEIIETIVLPLKPNVSADSFKELYSVVYHKLFDKAERSGLLGRFVEISNINFESFHDPYSKYKFAKLLYKFCTPPGCNEAYFGQSVNFYLLFRDSSFDNLDRTAITEQDNNGKCIAILKNELIKEIPFSFLMQCNEVLLEMLDAWDKCVYYAQDLLFQNNYVNGNLEDYEKLLASVIEKNLSWENYAKESANDSSLISTVYFWILEQECRCLRKDFLHINDHFMTNITENSYIDKDSMTGKLTNALLSHLGWKQECYSDKRELTINGVTVFKMYFLYETEEFDVGIEDIKPFLLYFKQELAEMLVTPKFTISEALTLIENSHKHIQRFINSPNKNYIIDFQPFTRKFIPASLIMASLYAMSDAYVNDEAINRSSYRGKQKSRLLMDTLEKINRLDEYRHILWRKKISCIQMFIKFDPDNALSKLRIESLVYTSMLKLFSIYDINDFIQINNSMLADINEYIYMSPSVTTIWKYSYIEPY